MSKKVEAIPAGFSSVTPYLIVGNSVEAIQFYKKAFNAKERMIMPGPGGKTMHAEFTIGNSIIMMGDENADCGGLGPNSRGGATSALMIYTEDVDAVFEKAVKEGCTVKMPLMNMFWGDRYGQVVDPFGHVWSLATHVEDVPEHEMPERSKKACEQMAMAMAGKK